MALCDLLRNDFQPRSRKIGDRPPALSYIFLIVLSRQPQQRHVDDGESRQEKLLPGR